MDNRNGPFNLQVVRGASHTIGKTTVTPISRRISLGLPGWFRPGKGLVLISQKPKALIVEKDGHLEKIPIRDFQQVIIFTLAISAALALFFINRTGHKEKNQ